MTKCLDVAAKADVRASEGKGRLDHHSAQLAQFRLRVLPHQLFQHGLAHVLSLAGPFGVDRFDEPLAIAEVVLQRGEFFCCASVTMSPMVVLDTALRHQLFAHASARSGRVTARLSAVVLLRIAHRWRVVVVGKGAQVQVFQPDSPRSGGPAGQPMAARPCRFDVELAREPGSSMDADLTHLG